jgi:hypothetical protein
MSTPKFEELILSILESRTLVMRDWIAEARRAGMRFDDLPRPELEGPLAMALAAGVAEHLAAQLEQKAPTWTRDIGRLPEPFYVGRRLAQMTRSAAEARESGPEPLRRRNVYASPNFLSVV